MTPSPLTLPALFEERIRWMRGHRYAKRTLESSQSSLEKFRCWCEAKQIHHLAEVNPALIENYQQWLPHQKSERGRPWSIRYQYHLLSEIITCFRWAYRQGYLLSDPCLTIQRPRLPQTLPRHLLSLQELEMLLRLPELGKPHGLRDRAILEVFYATAIRCKELLNLSIQDLDRRSEMIHIRQGKGEKDRIIPISERALKWVARYELEVREKWQLKGKGADFLFLSEQGKPFSQTQCEKRVGDYIRHIHPEAKGSCHLLRHSVATLLLEQGCDIRYIQEFLGHERIDSTQIYTKVSPTRLSTVYQRFHPSAQS